MATQICSDQEKPILLAQVAALEAELDCVKEMRIRAIQRHYFPAVQCLDDRIQDLLYSTTLPPTTSHSPPNHQRVNIYFPGLCWPR